MKLVSFNIFGGTIHEPLMEYLKKLSADTDIFCFQEVFSSLPGAPKVSSGARMFLLEELASLLSDFYFIYEPRSTGFDYNEPVKFETSHGLATFIKKNIPLISSMGHVVANSNEPLDNLVKAQVIKLLIENKEFSIINFHGISQPGDKLDTPERIAQSQKLSAIWNSLGIGAKILCGDFNLMPQTESVAILQKLGKDLIKDFNIDNTRNEISWKKFNNRQNFADYCFVSNNVNVKSFEVPYNEVSDHLPMILDFSLKS